MADAPQLFLPGRAGVSVLGTQKVRTRLVCAVLNPSHSF
jgi:hypothetical protein